MNDTNPNVPRADLAMLVDVAKSLAAEKDLDRLLELITHSATRLLRAERSSLYLYDPARNVICTRVIEADEIKEVCLSIGQGIAGTVAATREPIAIADCYRDERFDPSWDKRTGYCTRNMLCAPMLNHEGEMMGVLQVLNKREGCFERTDEDLILALGSLAAVALDNDRLVRHYLEKQKLEQSLAIARSIQQGLLPSDLPRLPGFELAAFCEPCDETGGDYYDAMPLPDGRLGLVVGDVTGHGIGPAILMAEARALLRASVHAGLGIAEALYAVNNLLEADLTDGRFVTLFFGALDPDTRVLHYSSAGHPPPIHYRATDGRLADLEATGPPLGIVPGMDYPLGNPSPLDPGDLLLLTTDGVEEAANGEGELFGRQRLADTLNRLCHEAPQAIVEGLRQAVMRHCSGAPVNDDITIVAVKARDDI